MSGKQRFIFTKNITLGPRKYVRLYQRVASDGHVTTGWFMIRWKPVWQQVGHLMDKLSITNAEARKLVDVRSTSTCEMCGATEFLGIDHNHQTGQVRGVLCNGCNIVVAALEGDRAQTAQSYLEKYQ